MPPSRYDDLTRPATPAAGAPPGIRVAFVSVTLPAGVREAAAGRPTPGRTLAGSVADRTGRPVVAAYGWVKIEDGSGVGFRISDLRLMRDGRGFFLNYPQEVRELRCQCGGMNKPKAKYCNWCGCETKPADAAISYHDLIFPLNKPSNDLVLLAMVAAYEQAIADARGAPHVPQYAPPKAPPTAAGGAASKI